ncbi:MAG: hypothetical protein ACKVJU_02790 [Verrucomicrobiales bacterium]
MNPRAPQQPGTQPQQEPDRPNPWGGAVAATPMPSSPPLAQTPPPADQTSNASAIHQLQCPHCRAGLTLRHEHIGINGSCIHCNSPIWAVAYQDGQVAIELIEAVAPQEVAEQTAPSPSLWQSQPEPQPQAPEQPVATQQNHAAPPPQENATPAWSQPQLQPSTMSQTEAAPTPNPTRQQQQPAPATPTAAPAFPSPNGAMPWNNATSQPPVVEQDNFESFQAASPFTSPPHLQEEAQAAPQPQPEVAPNNVVSASGKRLGKTNRKPHLRLLKSIATLIILGGLGYGAYLFAPKETVDQAKLWVGEFVKPALEIFNGASDADYSPDATSTPATPDTPISPPSPATTIQTAPASSITPELPISPTEVENYPASPQDPISEQLRVNVAGTTAIRQFYRAPSIETRLPFFVAPEKSRLPFDAYSGRFEALPTLKSVALQKATLDAATGRWYGIFEVSETENEKLHRWIVIEDEAGEFKLDWNLYEQLINDSLPRFLDDPTAAPREFRLTLRKGEPVPEDNNPWNSEATGLMIQTPFDSQSARFIVLKKSDYESLGLSEKINPTSAKVVRVEISWVPSEYDPNSHVPVITRLIGWGAWGEKESTSIQ